jgi:hypothetical protein
MLPKQVQMFVSGTFIHHKNKTVPNVGIVAEVFRHFFAGIRQQVFCPHCGILSGVL